MNASRLNQVDLLIEKNWDFIKDGLLLVGALLGIFLLIGIFVILMLWSIFKQNEIHEYERLRGNYDPLLINAPIQI
jgi:hypothetical protein